MTLLVLRFAVAGLVLLPFALFARVQWPRRRVDYGHLAVVGVLINAAALAAMGFLAFHETLGPLTLAGFMIAASGVWLGTRAPRAARPD